MSDDYASRTTSSTKHLRLRLLFRLFGVALGLVVLLAIFAAVMLTPVLIPRYKMQKSLANPQTSREVLADARRVMNSIEWTAEELSSSHVLRLNAKQIPSSIAAFSPNWVVVTPTKVIVELGGGHFHYGFRCYAEGEEGSGKTKVIDGLWITGD